MPTDPQLSDAKFERYARQMGPGVLTQEGQEKVCNSTVLVSRVGGMGGPAAMMLAMGGVGKIILAHGDVLISPDLNRQVLGKEAGLGQPRAPQFAETLRSLSQFVEVEALEYEPNDEQAAELAARCDLFISAPPTFEERLRLNRAAVQANIPVIDAAQWGMTGTLICVKPKETACLECVYPEPPPFEELFPVVGAISCATGAMAALEAIKILSGCGKPMWGKMFTYDGYGGRTNHMQLSRRDDCPTCSG